MIHMAVKHPRFVRQNAYKRRVSRTGWRKPRGIDNKLRISRRTAGNLPKVGYQGPRAKRHTHPSGQKEILVSNEKQLAGVTNAVVRLSGTLGKKKYEALRKKAAELKLRVLN